MSAYELVVGLEVHVELKTKSKMFCSCPADFGAKPNTQCCPVCAGMPGALPVLNRRAVELAVKAGLATGCKINRKTKLDRKSYFYPDLPKAYQISQFDRPLCEDGFIELEGRRIGIERIHIEEDAGKLVHEGERSLIDLNRSGLPLIEIVSRPDIRSAEEAAQYLKKLRLILLYADISDARMNEGSLRCDVNLSVRRAGERLGERTEIKNLNSFSNVAKAIECEYGRQVLLLESGGEVLRETRRFDEKSGTTIAMRGKGMDYRFMPEPDLPFIELSERDISRIKDEIPPLPDERRERYGKLGLSEYHSQELTADRRTAELFERAAELTGEVQHLAALILTAIPAKAEKYAKLADMLGAGRISSAESKRLLALDGDPEENAIELLSDEVQLREIAARAVAENPKPVSDYKNGKAAAFKTIMGAAMRESRGRANPVMLQQLLLELLSP